MNHLTHKAYLGELNDGRHIIYRVCAWCPGSQELTRELLHLGGVVSHGLCPVCYRREIMQTLPSPPPHERIGA